MYEYSTIGWLKHCIFHPVEGFEDLRWKKKGSIPVAIGIVVMLFIAMVVDHQLTGFAYNMNYVKVFNVVPLLVQSVVYFITWVVGNWALCTLLDGEGTFKKIFIYSAYALVPYIVCTFIAVILSNVLIKDESIWIIAVQWLGIGWSVILMIQAMRAAHQYSFGKTLVSMIGTVIVMLLILFLAVLLISLFQQLYVFIYQIYTEILYRVRG
ncbi:Yip1 family protein [Ruminococcus sp. NK3A76]|uniref:Yip1 family protein n=1 Tax=Ruminococcus sp. NK3A76 TaxID=877411 RepID=UPI00048CF86A|nr:Yip1 family protein [Ruminococcus sp. NK3A76]